MLTSKLQTVIAQCKQLKARVDDGQLGRVAWKLSHMVLLVMGVVRIL